MTTIILAVVAVVVGLAAGVTATAVRAARSRRAEETAHEQRVAELRRRLKEERHRVAVLTDALTDVETELKGAMVIHAAGDRYRRVLDATWNVHRLGVEAERRRNAEQTTVAVDLDAPVGLYDALVDEVDRIREEIGTPGTVRGRLRSEPDPAAALLLFRAAQYTLGVLARRTQAFDLNVAEAAGAVTVTVVCEDADVVEMPGEETTALARAIRPAGADLYVDRDPAGQLRAQLSIPVS